MICIFKIILKISLFIKKYSSFAMFVTVDQP